MGTEILRPQDCLIERIRVPPAAFCRRKPYYGNSDSFVYNHNHNHNPRSNKKPAAAARSERPEQRKRFVSNHLEPSVSKRTSSDDLKTMKNSMVMEKVTILRRGQSLDSKIKSENLKKEGNNLIVIGTERLGSEPEMVEKQIRIVGKGDIYAGSAFFMSPSPSSLPFPSFSKKKQVSAIVDDSATRDLRRLLRLDA